MDEPVIRLEGLTKRYGHVVGIDGLDLEVHRGEVLGLLGPNGAGKTTTIRLLLDLIRPTSGRALVFGLDARRGGPAVRSRIGYVPGEPSLYERLTGREHVAFIGGLHGGVDEAVVAGLAGRLGADLERPVRELSHGNRQKLALLLAFMRRPDLLILDEPTEGLDPIMRHEFAGLVSDAQAAGQTVVVSSHILPEIERTAGRVAMIRNGRLAAVEAVATLTERAGRRLEIRFAHAPPAGSFDGIAGVGGVRLDGTRLTCTVTGSPDEIVRAAARFTIVDIETHEASLDDVFMALYETGEGGRAA